LPQRPSQAFEAFLFLLQKLLSLLRSPTLCCFALFSLLGAFTFTLSALTFMLGTLPAGRNDFIVLTLGKRLRVMDSRRDRPTEIVGVVRDIKQNDLAAPIAPLMYFPATQRCWADAQLVVRTHGDPAALKAVLQRAVVEVDPSQTIFLVRTLDEILGNALTQRRQQMTLLTMFAGLALLLTAIGIYGVMSYNVAQRTQEIGVRLALGAQPRHMLALVLRQGLGLTVLGVVLGLAGALMLTRLLRSLLFEVNPIDPLTFALVPLLLLGVALLACYLPARRAARVDPMVALRYE